MKKKLLITVGAGASVDFDLPSVAEVDAILDRCASQSHPLWANPKSNLYRYCRDAIDVYYDKAPNRNLRKSVNFEEVLYQLNLLIAYRSDPYHLRGSNALLASSILPDVLEFGCTQKPVDGNVLRSLSQTLMDVLVNYFIEKCATVAQRKSAEIEHLRHFLAALQEEFEIGIVTLNYDNVFSYACPGLYTGFDATTGAFDPFGVLSREEWNFIYHLHGSVHFAMTGTPHDMHDISWVATPMNGGTVQSVGRNTQDSIEGATYPISPFVAGCGKTQQILRQPFRTYFAQVNRLAYEADSLLFLGYGFGDLHLNALFSGVRDRRRPVVVVDYANSIQSPLPLRDDTWTRQLFQTLPGNAHRMSKSDQTVPACIADLKATHELEVSNDSQYPLAVWYSGLIEACKHHDKILPHLSV